MKRSPPPKRKTPVRRVNRKRKAKRYEVAYGAHGDCVRKRGCVVGGDCMGVVQAAHVRSRGAGGTKRDLVGLCLYHHTEQHTLGMQSFQERHRIDLSHFARKLWVECECSEDGA